jgi:hypothetical protein
MQTLPSLARRAALTGLACVCAALTGCITPQVVATDRAALLPNQGLLVMQLKSNAHARLNFVDYKDDYSAVDKLKHEFIGSKAFAIADARVKKYIVMPLEAGDYALMNMALGTQSGHVSEKNKFTVVAGQINYIGQFNIVVGDTRYRMRVADEDADMRAYLAASYPGYLQSLPMVKALARLD